MSESWIDCVGLPEGEVLIFGADKDGESFRFFASPGNAEKIMALMARQEASLHSLLTDIREASKRGEG